MKQHLKNFFFSDHINQALKLSVSALLVISVFSLIAFRFWDPVYILAVDLAVIVALFFLHYFKFGFLIIAFLFPFVGWDLVWGKMVVPYGDLLAMFIFLAFVIHCLLSWRLAPTDPQKSGHLVSLPGALFAGLFLVASALSLINAEFLGQSGKYWLRPLAFFYLMFLALPYNIIQDKKFWFKVLKVMVAVGVVAAVGGLISMALSPDPWYLRRAMPFIIAGLNPLGGNHNALAEVLVAVIPFAIILFAGAKKIRLRNWYLVIVLLLMAVLLLTFSRAGWLALLLEMLILFFVQYRPRLSRSVVALIILLAICIPLIFYLTIWQGVGGVMSSDANRLAMLQIAWDSFKDQPWIGHGLNSFQSIVGGTFAYWVEFGDPLDAHGFVQKILVESGILGLLTFLSLLGYIFWRYLKAYWALKNPQDKLVVLCLIMMLVGVLTFQVFSTSYFIAKTWLPIGVGLAGIKLLIKNPKFKVQNPCLPAGRQNKSKIKNFKLKFKY